MHTVPMEFLELLKFHGKNPNRLRDIDFEMLKWVRADPRRPAKVKLQKKQKFQVAESLKNYT